MASEHHRRIRRAKRLLRFMPRRAVFHRYPLVGRWAALARREEYLWAFRAGPMRRAFYAGAILAMLPLMGVQLAIGLVVAIVARANFMVLGVLQFITNPFTAFPIYFATFVVGRRILRTIGFPMNAARLPEGWGAMNIGEIVAHLELGTGIGQGIICLVVGGVVAGLCLALLLDGVYFLGRRGAKPAPAKPAANFDPDSPPPVP